MKIAVIRFLLHTSDPALAQALAHTLRAAGNFEILPVCTSADRLAEELRDRRPDVALLELNGEWTFESLAREKRENPAKLVLWVETISPELAVRALELGVRGILRKSLPAALHIQCLRAVYAGESWLEKSLIRDSVCPPAAALAPPERAFLRMLAEGMKNQEIARASDLSEAQVQEALRRLFRKIGVRDRFELALYGLKHVPLRSSAADKEGAAGLAGDLEAIA